MASESTIALHVKSTADVAALQTAEKEVKDLTTATNQWITAANVAAPSYAKATQQAEQAVKRLDDEVKRHNVTQERARTSTGNFGNSMQIAAQAADDFQYSFAAGANQLGQFAQSIGIGAGVAGMVTLLGVGISQAIKHVDLFGTEAAEAAVKQNQLARAADGAAGAARRAAEDYATAKGYLDEHAEKMEMIADRYDRAREAVDGYVKAREAERRLAMAEADAAADLETAQVEQQVRDGTLTKQEGEAKIREIKRRHAGTRFDSEEQSKKDREKADRDIAEANRLKARDLEANASAKDASKENVLPSTERDLLEKRQKAATERRKAAEADFKAAEERVTKDPTKFVAGMIEKERDKAAAQRRAEIAQKEEATTAEALERDRKARLRLGDTTGSMSRESLEKEIKEQREEAEKLRREAAQLETGAERSATGRPRERSAFDTRQKAEDLRSRGRIRDLDNKDREEAERLRRQRQGRNVDRALDMGRAAGAPDDILDGVKESFREMNEGQAGSREAFNEFLGELKRYMAGQKDEVQLLKQATETLRSAR